MNKINIVFIIPSFSYKDFTMKKFVDSAEEEFIKRTIDVKFFLEPRCFPPSIKKLFRKNDETKWHSLFTILPLRLRQNNNLIFNLLYILPIKLQLRLKGISIKDSLFILFKPHQYSWACSLGLKYIIIYYDDYLSEENPVSNITQKYNLSFLKSAKLVCFTSIMLKNKYSSVCPAVHISNGVTERLLKSSLDWKLRRRNKHILPRRLGIVGIFTDSYDYDLIKKIAIMVPNVELLLIGRIEVNLKQFKNIQNVKFTGFFKYKDLPSYLQLLDVGLVPYKVNQFNKFRNPIKILEYFAYGLPVVTYACDVEVDIRSHVYMADSEKDFVSKVKVALSEDNLKISNERRLIAENNSLDKKSKSFVDLVSGLL